MRSYALADLSSRFVINGQTLSPGGEIFAHGASISFPASSNHVIIGASTQNLATATISGTGMPTITLGVSTYVENAAWEFIIAGQTISRGGIMTVGGMRLSLDTAGSAAVVGSGSSTEVVGLGDWIISGFSKPAPTYD